jgi:hypothetical protein
MYYIYTTSEICVFLCYREVAIGATDRHTNMINPNFSIDCAKICVQITLSHIEVRPLPILIHNPFRTVCFVSERQADRNLTVDPKPLHL